MDFATRRKPADPDPDLPPGKASSPRASTIAWHGRHRGRKTLVVCSRFNNDVYSYSLPELKPLRGAELTGKVQAG